jgi:hypothetical protein
LEAVDGVASLVGRSRWAELRGAAEIDRRGGCPGRRGGEHGHCWSRASKTEVLHWNVAANLI